LTPLTPLSSPSLKRQSRTGSGCRRLVRNPAPPLHQNSKWMLARG